MSGSALCENVGFPSASDRQTAVSTLCRHHPRTRVSWATGNHKFDIQFAYFSIFEYISWKHAKNTGQEDKAISKGKPDEGLGVLEEGPSRRLQDSIVTIVK
jgi:hypothetical protein